VQRRTLGGLVASSRCQQRVWELQLAVELGLEVGEIEVVLPGLAVVVYLPAAGDALAVFAEGAGEALREVER
jgi:hypothetical protein